MKLAPFYLIQKEAKMLGIYQFKFYNNNKNQLICILPLNFLRINYSMTIKNLMI